MHVAELWRYPVKSMAGERLKEAEVLSDGLQGDRAWQAFDARGRLVTARSRPELLGLRPGDPPPPDLTLRRTEARFDILPLLVATDGAIAAFGHDGRRLRPNIVVGGVEGLAERGWEGKVLRIGDVLIGLADLRERCVMTTFDPDTQKQDVEVLRKIRREFGGRLALNASVLRPGRIQEGEAVHLD